MKSQDPTAEQRRYWTTIAAFGCIICGRPAEIAHAHGPSLTARGFQKPKGKLFRWQHWLVVPACELHHRLADVSIDTATESWETIYGELAAWVDRTAARAGVDVWAKARALIKTPVPR